MTQKEAIALFEERWAEAKCSGCTSVLIHQDKWSILELVLEEAKRSLELRRELIDARMQLREFKAAVGNGHDESSEYGARAA